MVHISQQHPANACRFNRRENARYFDNIFTKFVEKGPSFCWQHLSELEDGETDDFLLFPPSHRILPLSYQVYILVLRQLGVVCWFVDHEKEDTRLYRGPCHYELSHESSSPPLYAIFYRISKYWAPSITTEHDFREGRVRLYCPLFSRIWFKKILGMAWRIEYEMVAIYDYLIDIRFSSFKDV